MKKLTCMFLILAVLLCGCAPAGQAGDPTDPSGTLDVTEVTGPDTTLHSTESGEEDPVAVADSGSARIEYTADISSVAYVTSIDQLPAYEALDGFRNEEFFRDHALVVVLDTVSSGSVEVSIESIDNGTVTLARKQSGDAGTTDMATFLVWAVVERDLDYNWTVANPAVRSNVSKY